MSLKLLLSTNGRVQVVLYASPKDGEQCNSMRNLLVYIRACLHGGGGSQVGEVTRLGGVKY